MSKIRIYNNVLCPDLWSTDSKLNPEVRVRLLEIAKDFYEKTKFVAPIKDIQIMGSIANYNWNSESDIDVHIIIDFKQLSMPEDTASKTTKVLSSQWNDEHDIEIKNHKVELNIQPITDTKQHVTGVYSLVKDAWVRVPTKNNPHLNKVKIVARYNQLKDYINQAIQTKDKSYMKSVKEYLDMYRQYGLDTKGELSEENIVFKVLRARGLLIKLKDAIVRTYDEKMSLTEINYKGISQNHPQVNKFNLETGKYDISKLTLGELKALKEKSAKFIKHFSKDPANMSEMENEKAEWKKLDAEIKRRMAYINSPVAVPDPNAPFEEGFGAGDPSKDSKMHDGNRWTVDYESDSEILKEFHSLHGLPKGEFGLNDILDTIQSMLDIAGIEPSVGTIADLSNVVISLIRAAKDTNKDERKSHLFDATISAISTIPMADFVKLLKIRKYRKLAAKGARALKLGSHIPKSYSLNEMPEMDRRKVDGKKLTLNDVAENIVIHRFDNIGGGYTLAYLMDSKESAEWLRDGRNMLSVFGVDIGRKETRHVIGFIEAVVDKDSIKVIKNRIKPGWGFEVFSLLLDAMEDKFKVSLASSYDQNARVSSQKPTTKKEGFDPTSMGPNPQATEGQFPSFSFYSDKNKEMRTM